MYSVKHGTTLSPDRQGKSVWAVLATKPGRGSRLIGPLRRRGALILVTLITVLAGTMLVIGHYTAPRPSPTSWPRLTPGRHWQEGLEETVVVVVNDESWLGRVPRRGVGLPGAGPLRVLFWRPNSPRSTGAACPGSTLSR
jgi:hypothetical protein